MTDLTITRVVPRTVAALNLSDRPNLTTLRAQLGGAPAAVARIVIGFLFACHGAQKVFGLLGGNAAAIGAWPGWYAGVIEFVGGVLIMFGLFTRAAAIVCSGAMAYAYFTVHQEHGALPLQNRGELAALYSWVFLMIAATGPGAFALDTIRKRRPA